MLRLLAEKEKGRGIPRPCILARVSSPVYPRPCILARVYRKLAGYVGLFQEATQPTSNARVTEFAERFTFDLAGAFAGNAEFATDFFEGA